MYPKLQCLGTLKLVAWLGLCFCATSLCLSKIDGDLISCCHTVIAKTSYTYSNHYYDQLQACTMKILSLYFSPDMATNWTEKTISLILKSRIIEEITGYSV